MTVRAEDANNNGADDALEGEGYITFSSDASFTIKLQNLPSGVNLQYSHDLDAWFDAVSAGDISCNSQNHVFFRGSNNSILRSSREADSSTFRISPTNGALVDCSGNIETLLDYATVLANAHPVMGRSAFDHMFYGETSLRSAPELPAQTLADLCYRGMFVDCTSLEAAPELPAQTLAHNCYTDMFAGCTSLKAAPELPAQTLANQCYANMFYGCTSLTTVPDLPAQTLTSACYANMFYGCSGLKLSETEGYYNGDYYSKPYRIPSGDAVGVEGRNSFYLMFFYTSGPFRDTPTINTTYYLVDEDATATINFYDEKGGNLFDTISASYGGATPTPATNPTKDKAVFAGWSPTLATEVTADADYYATWKDDKNNNGVADDEDLFNVIFKVDGEVVHEVEYQRLGYEISYRPDKKQDYTFDKWDPDKFDANKKYYVKAEDAEEGTCDIIFTALWKDDINNNDEADDIDTRHTITYTDGVDGEVIFGDVVYSVLVNMPTPHFNPAYPDPEDKEGWPVRTGYVFGGWTPAVAGTVTENKTYTAEWDVDANEDGKPDVDHPYTVNFDPDGKEWENAPDDQSIVWGNLVERPSVNPTAAGYVFLNWYKEDTFEDLWNFAEDKIYIDTTIYAKWGEDRNGNKTDDATEDHYTIRYLNEDGTHFDEHLNVLVGLNTPSANGTPTKANHKFEAWNPEVSETVKAEDDPDGDLVIEYMPVFYPDYNDNDEDDRTEDHFTITYLNEDGTEYEKFEDVLVDMPTPQPVNAPTKEGAYKFDAWSPAVAATVTADATYTATFFEDANSNDIDDETEPHYDVTYLNEDGSEYAKFEDVLVNTTTPQPAETPTKEGAYKFKAWDPVVVDKVTADATYKATFFEDANSNDIDDETEPHYDVTYLNEDGSEYAKFEDVLVNTTTPQPAETPTKEGYKFKAWDPVVVDKVTADATYTATFFEDANNNGTPDDEETADRWTVTYTDGVGGSVFANKVINNVIDGAYVPSFGNNPKRSGYIFVDWDKDVPEKVTSDLTFNATWVEENGDQLLVTFETDSQGTISGKAYELIKKGEFVTAPPEAVPVDGKIWVGWESSEGGVYDNVALKKLPITGHTTFTAKYADSGKAVVVFNYAGGKDASGKSSTTLIGDPGASYTVPDYTKITRTGYTATGWTPAGAGKFGEANKSVTYTLGWKANETTPPTVTTPTTPAEPSTDPNKKGEDGTPIGKGASAAAAEKAITTMKNDNDPAGSVFNLLQLQSKKQDKKSVTISWKKVKGAKKYVIYGNACGTKNKMKKLATVKTNKKVFKKVLNKKVKKGTYYKFIVVALDKNNMVVTTSKVVHVASKGGKVGNDKSVTIKAKVDKNGKKIASYKKLTKTVVNKGKKITLKGIATPQSKKLTVKRHRQVVFESSNPKIATVNKKGVVKGKKKGTCYIYAYAQVGVWKRIKITVK